MWISNEAALLFTYLLTMDDKDLKADCTKAKLSCTGPTSYSKLFSVASPCSPGLSKQVGESTIPSIHLSFIEFLLCARL